MRLRRCASPYHNNWNLLCLKHSLLLGLKSLVNLGLMGLRSLMSLMSLMSLSMLSLLSLHSRSGHSRRRGGGIASRFGSGLVARRCY